MTKDIDIDHIVITAINPDLTVNFFTSLNLGFSKVIFNNNRIALHFGDKKLNIHSFNDDPVYPRASNPTPGSLDICITVKKPIMRLKQELEDKGIKVEAGPVQRTGAQGQITSIYIRDPDGNLLEFANPLKC